MVALIQRVREASVEVDSNVIGEISRGMLILLGIRQDDTEEEMNWLARKCASLRIFPDEEGRMDRSVQEVGGEILVVPQFTLYGDTSKGNRPSFTEAAPPKPAEHLYEQFAETLDTLIERPVQTGAFGAFMDVHLVNEGPVTFWVEKTG